VIYIGIFTYGMLTFESGEAFGGATTILPGLKKQMDTVFN
jgi:hypothetical protein